MADQEPEDSGDEPPATMPAGKKRRLTFIAFITIIALAAGGFFYWLQVRNYESTDDAFIDGHIAQVSSQAGGRIFALLIHDNEQVSAGQVLAEIDPRDYNIKLAQAKAQKVQADAQVGLQEASIGQAQANVLAAEADNVQAQRDLKRFSTIDPKAITKQQRDNAIAAAKSAKAKLQAAQEAVEEAAAQKHVAEAAAQQAQVAVDDAELQLSYTKITAPIAGRITQRTVEVGNVVAVGQPLLAVVSNDLWVTANFKETQLTHMRPGQKVHIHIDAYPQVDFAGHVDSLQKGTGAVFSALPAENATGNYVKVVQRVPVKIIFDNEDQRDKYPLAPGLSVEPSVEVY